MALSDAQRAEVERLIPYARRIAHSFQVDGKLVNEDMEGDAYLALCDAVLTFDPAKGIPIDKWVGVVLRQKLCKRQRYYGLRRMDSLSGSDCAEPVAAEPCGVYAAIAQLPGVLGTLATRHYIDGVPLKDLRHELGLSKEKITFMMKNVNRQLRRLVDDSVGDNADDAPEPRATGQDGKVE